MESWNNFRKDQIWLNFAENLQVDVGDYAAQTSKHGGKLSDIKAEVYQYYDVANTKELKAKLKD